MPKQLTLALIVARPGPLSNSLQALMATMPQIEVLAQTADPTAVLRMGTEMQPDIVLMDASLPEEQVWDALRSLEQECPHSQSIVLADNAQQVQSALDAGADIALLKGHPAAKLATVIEELLSRTGKPPPASGAPNRK